jgi:hypothetical protein
MNRRRDLIEMEFVMTNELRHSIVAVRNRFWLSGEGRETRSRAFVGRREFLGFATAGAGAAATGVLPCAVDLAKPKEGIRQARYRETDHVRTFYRLNRY